MPHVFFVTGAYFPEISAAAVQCRAVAAALDGRARFSVLTTAVDRSLPAAERVEAVDVHRVPVDVRRARSKAFAAARLAAAVVAAGRTCDVVHVHGVSQKNVPVVLLARLLRKPIVLTLHTAGQDEPAIVRGRGRLAYWALRSSDLILCVSPDLARKCREAGVPERRLRLTPNGVDVTRFRPADRDEKAALKRALGWPVSQPAVLFVGFFSRDKRPDLLYRAWQHVTNAGVRSTLVYVGAKGSGYYEIDASLVSRIRQQSTEAGRAGDVLAIEPTNEIEQCFRAADVYVLPSVREANPLALLEAMAAGLPTIATRLPGATDVLIEDGANGRLVPPDDEAALAEAMRDLLTCESRAAALGARARQTATDRYDIRRTAEAWLAAYHTVLTGSS